MCEEDAMSDDIKFDDNGQVVEVFGSVLVSRAELDALIAYKNDLEAIIEQLQGERDYFELRLNLNLDTLATVERMNKKLGQALVREMEENGKL